MRQRAIILVVALLLGISAAYMVSIYANQAKEAAFERTKTVEVLVATGTLPIGATLDGLRARSLVETKKVPQEFVAKNAIGPAKKLDDEVLAVSLEVGEQLTTSKFKVPTDAGLAFVMPDDMVAVAIPINNMKAAGNLVKIGDNVNVVGTAKNEEDKVFTKTILQNVEVLAVNSELENQEKSGGVSRSGAASGSNDDRAGRTVTLALSQADAEKLIFMQEEGRIWLTLMPSSKAKDVSTDGQTRETVFK